MAIKMEVNNQFRCKNWKKMRAEVQALKTVGVNCVQTLDVVGPWRVEGGFFVQTWIFVTWKGLKCELNSVDVQLVKVVVVSKSVSNESTWNFI